MAEELEHQKGMWVPDQLACELRRFIERREQRDVSAIQGTFRIRQRWFREQMRRNRENTRRVIENCFESTRRRVKGRDSI